ncbi:uncharacterized protein LOC117282328 [Cryptotermes secundus]|uniref:uncharacterized protein LOC117282328 n=1 Tax=Cryptotermes secundus TaxID=105785 RepID=UPI001454E434|nr:uncharacterized protein LOC117282328 [Cryptotermes secundus]
MECALRVVIILVICGSISSAKSLLGDVQYQENQFGGIPSKILEAMKRYLIRNTNSDHNLHPYWIDRFITTARSSRLGSVHLRGEDEDRAYLTVQHENRDLTGRKSLQDDRITNEEGRKMKLKRTFIKMILWLKMVTLGLVLPAVVALSMVQSWKAVTISLLALGLAAILGIKNIVKAISGGDSHYAQPPQIVHSTWPTHHHNFDRTFKMEPESPIIVAHADHQDVSTNQLAYRRHQSA